MIVQIAYIQHKFTLPIVVKSWMFWLGLQSQGHLRPVAVGNDTVNSEDLHRDSADIAHACIEFPCTHRAHHMCASCGVPQSSFL